MLSLLIVLVAAALPQEPVVSKSSLSVHRVERGDMPLREGADGPITAISPPRVSVVLTARLRDAVKAGQACSVQVAPPAVLAGKLGRIQNEVSAATAELYLADPLTNDTPIGTKVSALIDVGVAKDVLFFARPADARPHARASVFVVEPDDAHARRAVVEYGRRSGALIEIVRGLREGDRVIVTDMSAWADADRVRLN